MINCKFSELNRWERGAGNRLAVADGYVLRETSILCMTVEGMA